MVGVTGGEGKSVVEAGRECLRCISLEEEYIFWKERSNRMMGGYREEMSE